MNELIKKVEQWFVDRNLDSLEGSGQLVKLQEEVDELKESYWKSQIVDERIEKQFRINEIDAVGGTLVVLIGYCMQRDIDIQEALETAYAEIKDRKGKVINGIFVKEEDL
ncbi:hypothetical protein FPV23_03750 [Carnobacterium sp. PL17RED31]|nr:hypothetical protein FPV23_03750 [Carnobacterium sp. PL17RED31]